MSIEITQEQLLQLMNAMVYMAVASAFLGVLLYSCFVSVARWVFWLIEGSPAVRRFEKRQAQRLLRRPGFVDRLSDEAHQRLLEVASRE